MSTGSERSTDTRARPIAARRREGALLVLVLVAGHGCSSGPGTPASSISTTITLETGSEESTGDATTTGPDPSTSTTATSATPTSADPSTASPTTDGDGTTDTSDPPVLDGCPHGLTALGSGGGSIYGCARTEGGRAACWSSPAGPAQSVSHADGTEITEGVRQVVGGGQHGCVLFETGAVHCWGNNPQNGGGQSTPAYRIGAEPVIAEGVTMLSGGLDHTCALLREGGTAGIVQCWGGDGVGQLGEGPAFAQGIATAAFEPGDDPISIHASYHHSCAALASGVLKCWGENQQGQIGIGTMGQPAFVPAAVNTITGVVGAAAGREHTCALQGDGGIYCWGNNIANETGLIGAGVTFEPTVELISRGIVQISAGNRQTLVLRNDGSLLVFGHGIVDATDVSAISAGETMACLARRDGSVACWANTAVGNGNPNDIEFADGTPVIAEAPTCD